MRTSVFSKTNTKTETNKGLTNDSYDVIYFYRTRVRSLFTLVTNSLTHWLTDSLTDCRLVNLIDVSLACEDGNSKLVEVVNVANVDDEDRVGNSLFNTWKLRLGNRVKLLFKLSAQGLVKVLTAFTSCRKVKLFDSNLEKQLQQVLSCHLHMPGSHQ